MTTKNTTTDLPAQAGNKEAKELKGLKLQGVVVSDKMNKILMNKNISKPAIPIQLI